MFANTWQPNEKADEKNRLITGNRHSSPFSSQTVRQLKRHPFACKKHRLNKKTSLNISFGTRGSIIANFCQYYFCYFSIFTRKFLIPKDMFRLVFLSSVFLLQARGVALRQNRVWEGGGELYSLPVIIRFFWSACTFASTSRPDKTDVASRDVLCMYVCVCMCVCIYLSIYTYVGMFLSI